MRLFICTLFSFLLVACDGLEFDSDNDTSIPFTSTELTDRVLFSSQLLNRDAEGGFIVLFESTSELSEIELGSSTSKSVLYGEYDWTIVNDKLQVTYPSGVICTSTKEEDNGLEIEVTAFCDGGTPDNAIIRDTLIEPLSFSNTSLSGRTVTISVEDNNKEIIEFNTDGSFVFTTKDEIDRITSTENGTYELSDFSNVVRLNYTNINTQEYSFLVLLQGGLSSGIILDLRYESTDDTLKAVRIYTVDSEDLWQLDDLYNSISLDI